jgi:hypothetical protein
MRSTLLPRTSLLAGLLMTASIVLGLPAAHAQWAHATTEFPPLPDQTPAVVRAAEAFLSTLTDAQRSAARYDWTDQEQRRNWSNFPEGVQRVARGGVAWGDLNAEQRSALMALLGTLLSGDGVRMVQEQMAADDTLDTRPGGRVRFGSALYFVSFLGEPSATEPWMLQFGGHHLGINATLVGPNVTLSPTLTGGQPLKFTLNGRPVYIVEEEAVQAAYLLASLTDAQRDKAIVSDARADLVLGPGRDGRVLQPEGLAGREMTELQQALFVELIEARLGILNTEDLFAVMEPIGAHLDATTFAWFGPTEPLGAAYWRVVGPTVSLEFAPQSMDDDPTNHAHNMYRDPTNEYGAAWAPLE